jgi:diaminohydroxyphosphoribosylaminopyrimidine deaminase/5-amino-6-(5-phosphoribosylamino)uracil reductase
MVGAVLVNGGQIIGTGWHQRAGKSHAEVEAITDATRRKKTTQGATLYVSLEPCCTHGRTPPCTEAIITAGIKRVIVGATDSNPRHRGRAFGILKRAGIGLLHGVLKTECEELNEAFNHWIVHRTPLVTVKAAMTMDGKIASASGESKWVTSIQARAYGMRLRQGADAILVGINTVLADDPSLTVRNLRSKGKREASYEQPRRIILDSMARTPLNAKVINDEHRRRTIIVVSKRAPRSRVKALANRVEVIVAPLMENRNTSSPGCLNLPFLLKSLGTADITSLLVEGGGEVNASFLLRGLAHRIAFFYAPKVLGGRSSIPATGGAGLRSIKEAPRLTDIRWRKIGSDLLLTARIAPRR